MYLSIRLSIVAATLVIAARAVRAEEPVSLSVPADLSAALIVACNDYVQTTAGDPAPFTVNDLPRRFADVSLARDGETAIVRLRPPHREKLLGGSLLYIIDLKTLTVRERVFGK